MIDERKSTSASLSTGRSGPSLSAPGGPDKTVRKAEPATTPVNLTHYTDLTGFKGIVENREFWLSHAAFLNDPEELSYGVKSAKRVLSILAEEIDRADPTANGRLKLINAIAADFEKFEPPDAFITCFCEDDDLLSQWRGYSSRQGISVTFDTSALIQSLRPAGAELMQVHYGTGRARKEMLSSIRQKLPDMVDDLEYILGSLTNVEIRERFSHIMGTAIPRFKHYGFREEREWRVVMVNPTGHTVHFRARSQLMLPYIKLPLGSNPLPIVDVTIGPGVQDTAVAKSIGYFLKTCGYSSGLVSSSSTPYRS